MGAARTTKTLNNFQTGILSASAPEVKSFRKFDCIRLRSRVQTTTLPYLLFGRSCQSSTKPLHSIYNAGKECIRL